MFIYGIARFAEKASRPDPSPRRPRRRPIELHQHHLHSQHPAVAFYSQVGSNIAQDANRVSTSKERNGECLRGGVGSPVESPSRSGGRHDQDSDSAANVEIRRAGGRRESKRPVIHNPSTGGYSFYDAPSPPAHEAYGEGPSNAPDRDQSTGATPRRARPTAPSPPDSYLGPTTFPYPYVSPDYFPRESGEGQRSSAPPDRAGLAFSPQNPDEGEIIQDRLCVIGRNLAQDVLEIVDLFERKKECKRRAVHVEQISRSPPLQETQQEEEHRQEEERRLRAEQWNAALEQEMRDAIDARNGNHRLAEEKEEERKQRDDRLAQIQSQIHNPGWYREAVRQAAESQLQRARAESEAMGRENRERSLYSRTHRNQGFGGSERVRQKGREDRPRRDAYDPHRSSM
ncbi:unnamed protein product [Zymoseptoria tritici ST99CH_3D1]|nr:unnamed protein product [Zymoseptoria tritici ST99CH_3D1]